MTLKDDNFETLSKLDNHIDSFTASLENGLLLDATSNITQAQATNAYKLLQNVNLLLERQQSYNTDSNKDVKVDEKITNRVTVAFQDFNYGFTLVDEKIYAIKRKNEDKNDVNKNIDNNNIDNNSIDN
ncbi:8882_t:CDS:2 [Diversispora eburnea]|uniref:8882_t:CDS:1 n=1 Tax=Diversispora eburnea TaxID=1213867 RepID=A0A9N8V397_9GLOM|nr:8882_t:CDS:2 [Diversispora eburnea]